MRLKVPGFAMAAVLAVAGGANAAPMLQLDIAGGRYDTQTKTIVADSNPFVLYALLTLRPNDNIQKYLNTTYYISAAVSPAVEQPGEDLGSFAWNGRSVAVTGDMVYGKASLERFDELQGHDSGDLSGHSIFPTYFTEFGFQFQSATRVRTYDTAVDRSGPVADANGGWYLAAFTVDTSQLDPRFVLHFDLYSTQTQAVRSGRTQHVGGFRPARTST